jgi:hypothetical protein
MRKFSRINYLQTDQYKWTEEDLKNIISGHGATAKHTLAGIG